MQTRLLYCLLALLGYCLPTALSAQTAPAEAEVLQDRNFIRIDQFGYPTTGSKVAIIAQARTGYNAGAGIELDPGMQVEVISQSDQSVAYAAYARAWNGGSVDDVSGDMGYWFDFTSLRDTGTYKIRLTKSDGTTAESYPFRVADDVYADVLRTAVEFFYYQRVNQEKTAEYGSGEPWTDGAWFDRPDQEYAVKLLDNPEQTRSMPKGWFDAGDPNKYVTFATDAVHALLTSYDQYPAFWNDFSLRIPESGNDVPDLLDEIDWEIDWIESMQDYDPADGSGSGGFYQKMGILEDGSYISPPSTDTRERWHNSICVNSTITGAGMLAHAALSYRSAGVWPDKVDELVARAEAGWQFYVDAPDKTERCDDGRIEAGDADGPGDIYSVEHLAYATITATYLYALTGEQAYSDFVAANFDVVLPDGGTDRSYVPTWCRTFRYLEILVETAEEPLHLYAPVLRRVTSSIPLAATWRSDDAALDRIVAAGRRTVEICTQDYFLTDAYYETMQYVGDTKVHALVWQALSGDDRHTRNALLDFHNSRNPEGMLKSCFPLRHNFYHSSYSLIYVDMVWDYFLRTHDTAFVRPLLPGIRLTMDYFDRRYDAERGLLGDVVYSPFVDWYPNGSHGLGAGAVAEASVPHTLQYVHALRSAHHLAEALGETGDDWGRRFQQATTTIRDNYYLPDRKLVAERPSLDFFDQHSSILGVLTGVVPEQDIGGVLETIVRDTSLVLASYYFRYYLLEALRIHQRADLAREALQPWYDMVAEGATTQVERLETPGKPTRSEAHPWGASPALFVYTLLAGIDDEDPEGPVTMAPAFGHLRYMEGYYPFLRGRGGVRFVLERSGPTGVRGRVTASGREVHLRWGEQEVLVPAGESRDVHFD